jgi:hypothetical protein
VTCRHFRVGWGRRDHALARKPPLPGASLRSSPLRSGSPTGDWSANILRIGFIKDLTPPRPAH